MRRFGRYLRVNQNAPSVTKRIVCQANVWKKGVRCMRVKTRPLEAAMCHATKKGSVADQ